MELGWRESTRQITAALLLVANEPLLQHLYVIREEEIGTYTELSIDNNYAGSAMDGRLCNKSAHRSLL